MSFDQSALADANHLAELLFTHSLERRPQVRTLAYAALLIRSLDDLPEETLPEEERRKLRRGLLKATADATWRIYFVGE